MMVDKTIEAIQKECGFDDAEIVRYVFNKLETERDLFWIQVARTITNRLVFDLKNPL